MLAIEQPPFSTMHTSTQQTNCPNDSVLRQAFERFDHRNGRPFCGLQTGIVFLIYFRCATNRAYDTCANALRTIEGHEIYRTQHNTSFSEHRTFVCRCLSLLIINQTEASINIASQLARNGRPVRKRDMFCECLAIEAASWSRFNSIPIFIAAPGNNCEYRVGKIEQQSS